MERIRIPDGTIWPDPSGKDFKDLVWKLRYTQYIESHRLAAAAEVMQAYSNLILHPAFTLKVVQKKISGIRNGIKRKEDR